MLLPDPMIYYLIIFLDFVLRFTWSLKLSSHLHSIGEMELGIFILEGLEVLRRWLWVFGRLEWEAVRKGGDALEERVRLTGDFGHGIHNTSPPVTAELGVTHARSGSISGGGNMDRRVFSANQRKNMQSPIEMAERRDETDADGEMGLGRSGVLIDVPGISSSKG